MPACLVQRRLPAEVIASAEGLTQSLRSQGRPRNSGSSGRQDPFQPVGSTIEETRSTRGLCAPLLLTITNEKCLKRPY
jgi:hypothetical protein